MEEARIVGQRRPIRRLARIGLARRLVIGESHGVSRQLAPDRENVDLNATSTTLCGAGISNSGSRQPARLRPSRTPDAE